MFNKKITKPLFVFGAGLMLVLASSVGATRASIIYQNNAKEVDFDTSYVSVDLYEGATADTTNLVKDALTFPGMPDDKDAFHIGETYPEYVNVVNSSKLYSEYVRVKVRKYWVKEVNGVLEKDTSLDPSLIDLKVDESVWKVDDAESTTEESVYYLCTPLSKAGGTESNVQNFIQGVTISDSVTTIVDLQDSNGNTFDKTAKLSGNITNSYVYDNASFYIEVEADAVQSHNAANAIYGAWGVHVTCDAEDDGTITSIEGKSTR